MRIFQLIVTADPTSGFLLSLLLIEMWLAVRPGRILP